jgi:hypothetical protein
VLALRPRVYRASQGGFVKETGFLSQYLRLASDTLKGVAIQTKAAFAACKNFSPRRCCSVCEQEALAWGLVAFQKIADVLFKKRGFFN